MTVDLEKEVRRLIGSSPHMSLATASENRPWVCEVHFGYDGDLNLYFVSKQDTRHCQEIVANPNVAGNIVKRHELTERPSGIYFEGVAEKLETPTDEQISVYCSQLSRDEKQVRSDLQNSERRMYKISVQNWAAFGDFDNSGKLQKHELQWNGGKK